MRDSNPHGFLSQQILSLSCIPISAIARMKRSSPVSQRASDRDIPPIDAISALYHSTIGLQKSIIRSVAAVILWWGEQKDFKSHCSFSKLPLLILDTSCYTGLSSQPYFDLFSISRGILWRK